MSNGTDATPDVPASANGAAATDPERPGGTGPSLTTAVRQRRTDQDFFLRLRDAIHQNHKALERLGT